MTTVGGQGMLWDLGQTNSPPSGFSVERLNRTTSRMAHSGDPSSSMKAAEKNVTSGDHKRQKDRALTLVSEYPDRTAKELALHVSGLGWVPCINCNALTIRKRLGELCDEGIVTKSGAPLRYRRVSG